MGMPGIDVFEPRSPRCRRPMACWQCCGQNMHVSVRTRNPALQPALSSCKHITVLTVSARLPTDSAVWCVVCACVGDGKQVVQALNRMREASVDPNIQLLGEALDLAYGEKDTRLQAWLRQYAKETLPQHHVLNRRLNAMFNKSAQGARGQPGNVGADRWKPGYSSSSSSSRVSSGGSSGSSSGGGYSGGGSSGRSSSELRDSWRPGGEEEEGVQEEGGWAAKLKARY